METLICRTCGCSLVRLGIREEDAASVEHDGERYLFCCHGCADHFESDPERYLQETRDLIVCPTCLAEKPLDMSLTLNIGGHDVSFCRCPSCVEVFKADPEPYLRRLGGATPSAAVKGQDPCCVR